MKRRLDAALVHRGLARSRTHGQELISQGLVLVNGIENTKASSQVADEVSLEIKKKDQDVGRGAIKLRNALKKIPLDINNKICLDVGASTGGFTQVLLESGAQKVYALDVGYGQIDWILRNNQKVVVLERFNARNLTTSDLPEKMDLIVADLSFISLTKVLPALLNVAHQQSDYLLMVKPQFELSREQVPAGGVVLDSKLRAEAVWKVILFASDLGLKCSQVAYSGLAGPSGNKEFFIRLNTEGEAIGLESVLNIVEGADVG